MRKIEKIKHPKDIYQDKLNELVDAVNDINEQLKKHYDGYHCPKQTQEPERKADGIDVIKAIRGCFGFDLKTAKGWYDKMRESEKEPECEYCHPDGSYKCPSHEEKPAKKECECNRQHYEDACGVLRCSYCNDPIQPPNMKKDELAAILFEKNPRAYDIDWNKVADEARKWAVEQVEKAFYDADEQYDGVLLDEVLARLKEGK